MAGAILTEGFMETAAQRDYAIVIDTKIKDFEKDSGINGQFFCCLILDHYNRAIKRGKNSNSSTRCRWILRQNDNISSRGRYLTYTYRSKRQ